MRWTTSGDQTRLCVTCSNSSAESAIVGTAIRAPSAGQSAYPKSHLFTHTHTHARTHARTHTHTHTHTRLTALCPRLPGRAGTRKVKPIWILLKQETVSGSGISCAMCKSAPRSRQVTTPAPHHSVFLQAGCSSCRPTNSIKALKARSRTCSLYRKYLAPKIPSGQERPSYTGCRTGQYRRTRSRKLAYTGSTTVRERTWQIGLPEMSATEGT